MSIRRRRRRALPTGRDDPAAVADILDETISLIRSVLQGAVDAGDTPADSDLDAAATSVIAQIDGLMVLAKARRAPSLLRSLGLATRTQLT